MQWQWRRIFLSTSAFSHSTRGGGQIHLFVPSGTRCDPCSGHCAFLGLHKTHSTQGRTAFCFEHRGGGKHLHLLFGTSVVNLMRVILSRSRCWRAGRGRGLPCLDNKRSSCTAARRLSAPGACWARTALQKAAYVTWPRADTTNWLPDGSCKAFAEPKDVFLVNTACHGKLKLG